MRKTVAVLLLACSGMASASMPTPDFIIGWFDAVERACSLAYPEQAADYRAGFDALKAQTPELSAQITGHKNYPAWLAAMQAKAAKMQPDALARECRSLLEFRKEGPA